jgi:putative phosphoesterase
MKVAIFGDIHGNLIALETFLNFTRTRVDAYVCTGDIVNYGPWSEECVLILKSLENLLCVKGNHEEIFTSGIDIGINPLVREFTDSAMRGFTQHEWIAQLPLEEQHDEFTVSHTLENRYIYVNTDVSFSSSRIIGHSHQQFIRQQLASLLVNPGSLGQNREFIDLVQFIILDSETKSFQPFSLLHDIDSVISEMKARNFSVRCLDYYQSKPRLR